MGGVPISFVWYIIPSWNINFGYWILMSSSRLVLSFEVKGPNSSLPSSLVVRCENPFFYTSYFWYINLVSDHIIINHNHKWFFFFKLMEKNSSKKKKEYISWIEKRKFIMKNGVKSLSTMFLLVKHGVRKKEMLGEE